jgi:hypothetical protein
LQLQNEKLQEWLEQPPLEQQQSTTGIKKTVLLSIIPGLKFFYG